MSNARRDPFAAAMITLLPYLAWPRASTVVNSSSERRDRVSSKLSDKYRTPLRRGQIKKFGDRKVGRNEPCPCGSGNKFKRCHGHWSMEAEA